MNKLMRGFLNCPKCCLQNCEYSAGCLDNTKVRNSPRGFIFSKGRQVISRASIILRRLLRKDGADDYQAAEPYEPIHPAAKYVFSRTDNGTFDLDQHIGRRLFGVRAVHLKESPFPLMFSHSLEDEKGRIITSLTFLPEFERQACGTYNNHALLVELSEDSNEMTLLVFENMGIYQTELLQRRNAGELVVGVEIKPLLDERAGKRHSERCTDNNVQWYTLFETIKKLLPFKKKGETLNV